MKTSVFQEYSPYEEIRKLDARNNLTDEERAFFLEGVSESIFQKVGRPVDKSSKKQIVLRLFDLGFTSTQIAKKTGYSRQIIFFYKSNFWKKKEQV